MTTQKPAILFVSGAWHTPAHYAPFTAKLEAQGYEVFVPQLPTCGGKAGTTWKDDVPFLHSIVEPHMDLGKEFIVVCHSYGGIPGCTATKGYTVEERQQAEKKGGFRSILFVAAFAMPGPGLNILQCLGGKYPPWMMHQPAYQGVIAVFPRTPI
ncbi:hypothetical protein GGS26DRAFT_555509 [Hypomontagnella submonticulosa]|nr:hypothetical protein GGS26DRAFT_555509 [Hypomontagnella submonticulosa]